MKPQERKFPYERMSNAARIALRQPNQHQAEQEHIATVAEILEERDPLVVLCGCFGCRTHSIYGCTKRQGANDWQAVNGY